MLAHVVSVPSPSPRRSVSDVVGVDLSGAPASFRVASPGSWTLLLFLGSRCDGCLPFFEVPRTPAGCGLDRGDVALVVTRDPGEEDPGALAELVGDLAGGGQLVMSSAAWRAYVVHGPPFFVLSDGSRVATEGVAWSVEQVAADVRRAKRPGEPEAGQGPRVRR